MRPADVERRGDRRLFLGLLPISFGIEQIRERFGEFGEIKEVQILRNTNGTSKRCAFLTYSNAAEARLAIEKMNNCLIAKDSNQHIVVKKADTPKEKEQRKLEKRVNHEPYDVISYDSCYDSYY